MADLAVCNADVDNDNAVTPWDMLNIQQYVTGFSDQIELVVSENATLAGDFNCDNKVDITDAVGVSELLGNSSTFSELLDPSATEIAYDLDMSNVYLESGRDSYAEGTITFEIPDTNAKCVALHGKLTLDGYDLGDMGFELVELAIQHVGSFDDYRYRVTFVPNYETGEFSVIIPNDGSASVTLTFELECQAPTNGAYYDLCLDADIATATNITSTQVTSTLLIGDIPETGPAPTEPEPTEPVPTETEPTEATGSAPTDPPEDAPVTFKEQAQVNGDVDMDCCLSMLDVYGIMRYAAGMIILPLDGGIGGGGSAISYTVSEQALENVHFGDFNCDGVVNTADAAALYQYIEQGDAVLDAIEDPSDDEEELLEYTIDMPGIVYERQYEDYVEARIDVEAPQTEDYIAIEGAFQLNGRSFDEIGFEMLGAFWSEDAASSGLFVCNEQTGEFSWILQCDETMFTTITLVISCNDIIDEAEFRFDTYDTSVMNAAGLEVGYIYERTPGVIYFPPIEYYEPDPTEPDTTEPEPTETEATEPAPTEPAPTETEPTEATEPAPTEPAPTEPAPTETEPTEATEPAPTEPEPTETEPTEATEPEPTEPAPTEPAPETTPYSEEQLIEWAVNDYETRNGAAPADAQLTENEDDTVSIVLTNAAGEILETYVIDPVTGEGVFGDGTYVTLPQTGRYDMTNYYIAFGALLCVGMGLFLVIRSGLLRKKREN